MNIQNIDWSKKCLKSLYRDSQKEQFYVKIFGVVNTIPSGFKDIKELCFDCQCYEEQGMRVKRTYLRCSLIGSLYEIVDIPDKFRMKQYSIFDYI